MTTREEFVKLVDEGTVREVLAAWDALTAEVQAHAATRVADAVAWAEELSAAEAEVARLKGRRGEVSEGHPCPTCTASNEDKSSEHDAHCELTSLRSTVSALRAELAGLQQEADGQRQARDAAEVRAFNTASALEAMTKERNEWRRSAEVRKQAAIEWNTAWHERNREALAADSTVSALRAELAESRSYSIDLQRVVESIKRGVPPPEGKAPHHRAMAMEILAALATARSEALEEAAVLIEGIRERLGIGVDAAWFAKEIRALKTKPAPEPTTKGDDVSTLHSEIEITINRHSAENGSNTPDFILAEYLVACLAAFDGAVNRRSDWYGRRDAPGQSSTSGPASTPPAPSDSAGPLTDNAGLLATLGALRVSDEMSRPAVPSDAMAPAHSLARPCPGCAAGVMTDHLSVSQLHRLTTGEQIGPNGEWVAATPTLTQCMAFRSISGGAQFCVLGPRHAGEHQPATPGQGHGEGKR